jgi:NADPH:quinone reductase-like Zn-dependent oxidoreductase
VGDQVFGESVRGYQWRNGGSYAEYVAVPAEVLALKPANLTFEEAAAVPTSALIALQGIRHQGQVEAGHKVLVNGAAGGVGMYAVQLAKSYGAVVTGVDSTDKLDIVRSAGADRAVDYTQEDFTRGSERYDLILDVPGNHSWSECKRALKPEGTYVLIGHDHFGKAGHRIMGSIPRFMKLVALSPFVSQLPKANFSMPPKKESMAVLKELLEEGQLKPLIDKSYPLSDVPDAIRYMQEGRARGKIVITV